MTPKTAEIISRTAAFRDRGISRESVTATLMSQYTWTSLSQAAMTLGARASEHPANAIVEASFERKIRRAA